MKKYGKRYLCHAMPYRKTIHRMPQEMIFEATILSLDILRMEDLHFLLTFTNLERY
jgi:hypothetical protein